MRSGIAVCCSRWSLPLCVTHCVHGWACVLNLKIARPVDLRLGSDLSCLAWSANKVSVCPRLLATRMVTSEHRKHVTWTHPEFAETAGFVAVSPLCLILEVTAAVIGWIRLPMDLSSNIRTQLSPALQLLKRPSHLRSLSPCLLRRTTPTLISLGLSSLQLKNS